MGGVYIQAEVHGNEKQQARITQLTERVQDLAPGFLAVATYLLATEAAQFESQGAYASKGWAAIKDATLAAKLSRGGDPRILIDTGRMMKGLTEEGGEHVQIITKDSLTFGTTDPIARFHHTGTKTMPRRDPLTWRADRTGVLKILRAYVHAAEGWSQSRL